MLCDEEDKYGPFEAKDVLIFNVMRLILGPRHLCRDLHDDLCIADLINLKASPLTSRFKQND